MRRNRAVKLSLSSSPVTQWFVHQFTAPTPAQAAAWPIIQSGHNLLLAAPTGTGKTLAAFLAILNHLALEHARSSLRTTLQAVYISPLRALGYDLQKNLQEPLLQAYDGNSPIRVALRNGDTPPAERQRQWRHPPHLLLTTPESLCLLLSQSRWLDQLSHIRWIVVDEIHALAENKRGVHLSLSLERLQHLIQQAGRPAPQRIGLSATVAPLADVAEYLVGPGRRCEIADISSSKSLSIRVHTPLRQHPYPPAGFTGKRLMRDLATLIQKHRTTLVFSNTRSGAEAATYWLHRELPDLADRIECHHASLDRDVRLEVEDRLKRGELRAVVCSTSLELGIDIGAIDLVVMLSTPKGVSKALQRTGRSGHNIHSVSRGLLMATNLDDLVESCATALLARRRHLDLIRLPGPALDVLAQHLVSMGCTQRWIRADALALVRRTRPFHTLPESDLDDVLDFLAGGGRSLRAQYADVFGKIDLDDEGFQTRGGAVRRDFLANIGTIPNDGLVQVRLRNRALGSVEESFIRLLHPGDVFTIGGRLVRLERMNTMECHVTRADRATPTVPRWNANKMPLSNRVAEEISRFRSELRQLFEKSDSSPEECRRWIARRLECGAVNARHIHRIYSAQQQLSEIPTSDALLIEEYLPQSGDAPPPSALRPLPAKAAPTEGAGHYFFHALVGRTANDAISRVVALRLSRLRGGNAVATPNDYGFVLTIGRFQGFTTDEARALLAPEGFRKDLEEALAHSHLLQYHFRNTAQTGGMIHRNYFGNAKPLRKLQFSAEVIFNVLRQHEPHHVLLRAAREEALHQFLDAGAAESFLQLSRNRPIHIRPVSQVPPLSFALYATKIKEALLVENPAETLERLYHFWWNRIQSASH